MPWGLALKAGPWLGLAAAALVIWGLWGQLGTAKLKLASAQAVIAQREEDMKLSALEIAKLHGKVEQINATAAPVRERIIQLPATTACAQTPAMREAVAGVRALLAPK